MAQVIIEGSNLGERHKHFNILVKEAIANKKQINTKDLYSDDFDINNLINIDVANKNKDVDYIMEVLTCEDMLYVTRAINNCSWLICDEYAHIINAEYLSSKLYPRMQSKAIISFKQVLRTNIDDESRAEEFFKYEQKPSDALRWLPKCSIKFIETKLNEFAAQITPSLVKRLCEKSIIFLEMYVKCDASNKKEVFEKTLFLIHVDIDKYLDIVESQPTYFYPTFGKRATKFLMTKCSQRVLDKFGDYCVYIDTPTFVKYLKNYDLRNFLYKEAINSDKRNNELNTYFYKTRNWDAFLNAMPKNDIFKFIKEVFVDKLQQNRDNDTSEIEKSIIILRRFQSYTPAYYWYQFLTFELAFSNIKSMIGPETEAYDKSQMFETLLISAKGNLKFATCVLQYFRDKHMSSSLETKIQFINSLITKFNTHYLDKGSWCIFEEIINSMDIFNDLESNALIIEALIIYKVLNNENVPDDLAKAFKFSSLKMFRNKFNAKEKEIIFNYLQQLIWKEIENSKTNNVTEFENCVDLVKTMLTLLQAWDKIIIEYPLLLDKIRQLLSIKRNQAWPVNLLSIYNLEKSWRKYMFNESILLSLTEEVCMNSLKHGPNLLKLYREEVESILFKDSSSLKRLLRKVRIYWPQSFCQEWKDLYLKGLDRNEGLNAISKGLCFLLPRSQLFDILKKYAPKDPKIDWSHIQEVELSLQRNFAKNMHRSRPQPQLETILWYSKGDYLQYALPSLLAIYYNASSIQFQRSLPKLLDTPVSLQKHGVRFVFTKLSSEILKEAFRALWKKTQNTTIRTEIFITTHKILCKEKNALKIIDTWILLEMFIDTLTFQENKKIYKLLYTISDIPLTVKPNYLMKSYNFLKTLIANDKHEYARVEWDIRNLARQSREIMELLPSQFVVDLISELISKEFFEEKVNTLDMPIVSSYLLCAKDEESQLKKYNEVFAPIQRRSFESWNQCNNQVYNTKTNFELLICNLINDLKVIALDKGMIVPVKLFSKIQNEMEKSLSFSENYILLRTWQLATQLVTLLEKNKPIDWEKTTLELAPQFSRICQEYLWNDTKSYFPSIYILFTKALGIFKNIFPDDVLYEIGKSFVQSEDFIPGFLTALKLTNLLRNHEDVAKLKDKIRSHTSIEVQMHYYDMFKTNRASLLAIK